MEIGWVVFPSLRTRSRNYSGRSALSLPGPGYRKRRAGISPGAVDGACCELAAGCRGEVYGDACGRRSFHRGANGDGTGVRDGDADSLSERG